MSDVIKPFERREIASDDFVRRFRHEINATTKLLDEQEPNWDELVNEEKENKSNNNAVETVIEMLAQRWMLDDQLSEIAFRGLLVMLEYCLSCETTKTETFTPLVEALSDHGSVFWVKSIPYVFESDMQYGTSYRDALLFSLTLNDVTNGKYKLRELFGAVPGLRNTLLSRSEKRFEEAYHAMIQKRRVRANSLSNSSHSSSRKDSSDLSDFIKSEPNDHNAVQQQEYTFGLTDIFEELSGQEEKVDQNQDQLIEGQQRSRKTSNEHASNVDSDYIIDSMTSSVSLPAAEPVVVSSLGSTHFQERVITVSNAPPVSFKIDKKTGKWKIGQGSGGLVSCCEPVMCKDTDNVWLAYFGPDVPVPAGRKGSKSEHQATATTNSLGLPQVRTGAATVSSRILSSLNEKEEAEIVKSQMSLLGILKSFSRDNYNLKPVIVPHDDYETYYCGISNGLLWPAFHNLNEYIAEEYNDMKVVREHWNAYVRVNYQFALNAVRRSRSQDFLWIHDYHLMLVGLIIKWLDPTLEVGFFLHIPFQPADVFFSKFKQVAQAVVRALLGFTKVGFQTDLDMEMFLKAAAKHCSSSRQRRLQNSDKFAVAYKSFRCSFGVFPVSIKNEDFLIFAESEKTKEDAMTIRQAVIKNPEGKMFFSAERFDYTKGIKEKLNAINLYFEQYSDRIGKDVFFQVAVINRRAVEMYKKYQDDCIQLVENINRKFHSSDDPTWKPVILQMDGFPRPELIAHFLAMDIGIVTPIRDGMNLVAKEMLVCNRTASLVLSTGAGTERQLNSAGLYTDNEKCYHRVIDIRDATAFAQVLYDAAVEQKAQAESSSLKLHDFLIENDIEKWSTSFLDPGWTHEVIHVRSIKAFREFFNLMQDVRTIRRQIVSRVLKGVPLKSHYGISLTNAQTSLEQSTNGCTNLLPLSTNRADCQLLLTFDITDEIRQLELDLAFLNYIQSETSDNLEQFLSTLSNYHEMGTDVFNEEVDQVFTLLKQADHFKYFFTDRDGTMTSYACSYASSIQSAYSGVIQATFAQRCTQYSAIVTSAPLCNVGILDVTVMPNGYYCYGSSGGREWFINENKVFKDDSIIVKGIRILNKVADKIAEILELEDDFTQFWWLGSGLQRHYGHVTVAKQDCYNSVEKELSSKWSRVITDLVNDMDPCGSMLSLQETATDIKIYLKDSDNGTDYFDKGQGIRLFAQRMSFNFSRGNILLCADSESDLPMLQEVLEANPENVYTVWVTKNEELTQKVIDMCQAVKNSNYVFVTSPLVIVGAMALATIREIKIRSIPYYDSFFDEQVSDI